jgi:hypothetical protein
LIPDTATLLDSAIATLARARTFPTTEEAARLTTADITSASAHFASTAYLHGNLLAAHLTALADTGTDIDDAELTDPNSWQAKLREYEYLRDTSPTTTTTAE